MHDFDAAWRTAVRYRKISRELDDLVRDVHDSLSVSNAKQLRAALVALLEFLSGEGRTDANCCAVDAYFSALDESVVESLPAEYRALVSSMGGTLHDAVYAPRIAQTFESLPEQLLERARALPDR